MIQHREVRESIQKVLTPEQREKLAWMRGFMAGHRPMQGGRSGGWMGSNQHPPMGSDDK
jgi:hypothetical protein